MARTAISKESRTEGGIRNTLRSFFRGRRSSAKPSSVPSSTSSESPSPRTTSETTSGMKPNLAESQTTEPSVMHTSGAEMPDTTDVDRRRAEFERIYGEEKKSSGTDKAA